MRREDELDATGCAQRPDSTTAVGGPAGGVARIEHLPYGVRSTQCLSSGRVSCFLTLFAWADHPETQFGLATSRPSAHLLAC